MHSPEELDRLLQEGKKLRAVGRLAFCLSALRDASEFSSGFSLHRSFECEIVLFRFSRLMSPLISRALWLIENNFLCYL